MDVTIRNVPDGCESQVKEMAMMAIERFLNERDMHITKEVETKFEKDVDTIRVANSLNKKFVVTGTGITEEV